MNARLLSFALLLPVALSSIEKCSATPPTPVHFRAGTQVEAQSEIAFRAESDGDGTFDAALGSGISTNLHDGRGAISIASGDFNGDGIPDIVIGQCGRGHSSGVMVFLGRSDGALGKGTVYAANLAACYVAVGDVNHDGKVDIIAANAVTASFEVLGGNGDGTFRAPIPIALPGIPRGVIVADFNGDGWADVAVAGSGEVYTLLNDRKGSLLPAVAYSVSGSGFELVAADVNKDGKLDLCIAMSDTTRVAVLLGRGDGTFEGAADYDTGISSPYGIAVADLNHDGKADLVVTAPASGRIAVATGNGDGTFNSPAIYAATLSPFGGAPSPVEVALADVNGDGSLDIVFTNSGNGMLGVLLNDGSGEFYGPSEFSVGGGAVAMAVADLDRDGRPDVVTAGSYVKAIWILYNATGSAELPAAKFSPNGLVFGNQKVNVTSRRQTFTVANTGGSTLNISSILIRGTSANDFSEHNNCGGTLPPNSNCNINVSFTPSALGPRSAAVEVTDDAVGSPHRVGLAGTGGTAIGRVTPSSVAFGGTVINTTSAPKTVTLLNNGTYPMMITSVTTTGQFAIQTNGCTAELDPGVSCNVDVVFVPTQLGALTGALTFVDDASNSPQTATLTGTGQPNTTTTKLTANPNPVVVGHALTLTVHVNPTFKGTPTGTVTFYDGATVLGTASLSAGMAQFVTSSLTAGSHTLTAVYGGDAVFQGSTSPAVTEQVNQAIATVSVVSSGSPVYVFQDVVFTASVSADGGIVATGTMTFQQGSTSLGTVALVNGQASVTTSYTTAGIFRVTATYSGDQNYKTNSSYVDEEIWWAP